MSAGGWGQEHNLEGVQLVYGALVAPEHRLEGHVERPLRVEATLAALAADAALQAALASGKVSKRPSARKGRSPERPESVARAQVSASDALRAPG